MSRFALLLYFILYFTIAFVWRSYLVKKRTGINPYVLGNSDNAYDFIGWLFRLTVLGVAVDVLVYTFAPAWYVLFTPLDWLQRWPLSLIGWILLFASLIWIAIAQAQMGASWRIGIDRERQTTLIETGLFARSRNPIFVGMTANLIGFFLILPNAFSLVLSVLGSVLIQIQVRLEEEHLRTLHGASYDSYCQRIRRWL